MCGIGSGTTLDNNLEMKAYATQKTITADLAYNNGPPPLSPSITKTNPERKHESCYYVITNGATESQIGLFNRTSTTESAARIYI
jgi:hypothetical protein